jgi:NAD(P)-dependent dehydrogenase (short-subunit alcohol dehydrogenase family)
MVAHAMETFGRLDYAVNIAGIEGKFAGITDLPEQEWDRVLDTNPRAVRARSPLEKMGRLVT